MRTQSRVQVRECCWPNVRDLVEEISECLEGSYLTWEALSESYWNGGSLSEPDAKMWIAIHMGLFFLHAKHDSLPDHLDDYKADLTSFTDEEVSEWLIEWMATE